MKHSDFDGTIFTRNISIGSEASHRTRILACSHKKIMNLYLVACYAHDH
jgi:hypothetical protein